MLPKKVQDCYCFPSIKCIQNYFLHIYATFLGYTSAISCNNNKNVYTYVVPSAILIITLCFCNYDRCVVINTSGVRWLNAVFLHCEEGKPRYSQNV